MFLPLIKFDEDGSSLGRSTRRDPSYSGVTLYDGYTLSNGNIEDALQKVFEDLMLVLPALEDALKERLSFLNEDPVFSSAAKLLDTTSYENLEEEDLLEACELLIEHFKQPLESNGFIKQRLCEFYFSGIYFTFVSRLLHLLL